MWVAKLKFSSKGTLIGSKAAKHNVELFGFPLSYYQENDSVVVQLAGTIFGKKRDKLNFFKEMKREKRVLFLEVNGDFIVAIIREPEYTNDLYQKNIFYVSPAHISSKGYETLEIASFDRKLLSKIILLFKSKYDGILLGLQRRKIKSISIAKIHPELTLKQRKAIDLAIHHGYYFCPRKISVKELAKLAKLSFSTYQVHLRKAESKLMPYYIK